MQTQRISELELPETEEGLVNRAQNAISGCNWVVGACAAAWTVKHARGRTDADFGEKLGLSGDQVYQRRRVWESFSDVADDYPSLKWSHFYVAVGWDDAAECLQWSEENKATIAEMKAWRRLQRGEDLTVSGEFEGEFADDAIRVLPDQAKVVREPGADVADARSPSAPGGVDRDGSSQQSAAAVGGAPRQSAGDDYAPFRKGAGQPAPQDDSAVAVAEPPKPDYEQTVKRMTTSLERCVKVLTPEFAEEFPQLPDKVRNRFIRAVGELASKTANLRTG